MISVVLMAGYQNKREVKRYSKIVAEHYGESFVETGYRPLREFSTFENNVPVKKPLIQYTLEKLFQMDAVEDITVVGHQMLLEQRLRSFLAKAPKPFKIVNQNIRLSTGIVEQFKIEEKQVKYNSIAANMVKGYWVSNAAKTRRHALFVAADSPLTTAGFVERFIDSSRGLLEKSAIVVPAIFIDGKEDKLGRKPLWLINDSLYPISGYTDPHGRQGFRLSALLMANPFYFDINTVNTAYNLRKFLSPKVQIRLFKITRELGFSNVYAKHFIKKDLSVTDCEKITSQFFRGTLSLLPLEGETASYDYDGTEKEYQIISSMLTGT
jgi:hypothetical protein